MDKNKKEDIKFILLFMCCIFIPVIIICVLYQAVVIGSPEDRYETEDCLISSLKITPEDYGVKIRGFVYNKSGEDWDGADIVCDVYQNGKKTDTIRIFIGGVNSNIQRTNFFYKYRCNNPEGITVKVASINYTY